MTHRHSIFLLATLLFAIGCGTEEQIRIAVSGTVTLDGQPVNTGQLSIVPVNSGVASAASVSEGRFSVSEERGPQPGEYRFRLTLNNKKALREVENPKPVPVYETTMTVKDSEEELTLVFTSSKAR